MPSRSDDRYYFEEILEANIDGSITFIYRDEQGKEVKREYIPAPIKQDIDIKQNKK